MKSAPGILPGRTLKLGGFRYVKLRPGRLVERELVPPAQQEHQNWAWLGGAAVQLMTFDEAVNFVLQRAAVHGSAPLAVASANLDHIKHFGHGGKWTGVLEANHTTEWLTLLDGAPLVTQAHKITHHEWPRLAGSDLTWPLLDAAESSALRVGFLGGRTETHRLVRERLSADLTGLKVAGYWAPERSELADPTASLRLAAEVASADVDILFVCLGKPRQELWINEYGHLTGAKVMLAFGAAVDFLAGTARRAPERVRDAGLEWAWRLAIEPRRLASRYLVDGPRAYLNLRAHSGAGAGPWTGGPTPAAQRKAPRRGAPEPWDAARFTSIPFTPLDQHADVAVLIVTYNSEETVPLLLEDLRRENGDQSIKVIVADNSPSSGTIDVLAGQSDLHVFRTGGNLGYAAGINLAMKRAGTADAFLVLNPDVRLERGCVSKLRQRMRKSSAGVVVPLLLEDDGGVYPSLRREPTVSRAIGDAVLGSRLPWRPGWLSEMDFSKARYTYPHQVEWATGAALLIDADVANTVGDWDERYFLYSEETDFLRRVRRAGAAVWFDPVARMRHSRGASGASTSLEALMAANRVRYIRKFRPVAYARIFHGAVILSALLRAALPDNRGILSAVAHESRWDELPHSDAELDPSLMPKGSVVIPAHNEAAVLARTLAPLASYAAAGMLEVIVACNACTDGTADIARSYPGVRVVEIKAASKTAALNAADSAAHAWPRLYLDADIEIRPAALAAVFSALTRNGTLAARPDFVYDSRGAHWLVRAYFRARFRMPSQQAHLWGAGAYAVSADGHSRFREFPEVTADDLFIDSLFDHSEKTILHTRPVIVRTPRAIKDLQSVLRRTYRGNAEQGTTSGAGARLPELLRSVRGPQSALDAAVYVVFALKGRAAGRPSAQAAAWERDESSRGSHAS